jgi:hypothetical protein
MIRTTVATFGVLALLAGTALAAPPPNDVGMTGMGGGVYYNPGLGVQQARPASGIDGIVEGTADEGGGVYHLPANQHR